MQFKRVRFSATISQCMTCHLHIGRDGLHQSGCGDDGALDQSTKSVTLTSRTCPAELIPSCKRAFAEILSYAGRTTLILSSILEIPLSTGLMNPGREGASPVLALSHFSCRLVILTFLILLGPFIFLFSFTSSFEAPR